MLQLLYIFIKNTFIRSSILNCLKIGALKLKKNPEIQRHYKNSRWQSWDLNQGHEFWLSEGSLGIKGDNTLKEQVLRSILIGRPSVKPPLKRIPDKFVSQPHLGNQLLPGDIRWPLF